MRFDVLGPLHVERDGEGVEPGPFKQRSLLALLLINRNRVVSTDRIIDELWGADASTDRQGALWVHLSNLRSALEPDRPKGSPGSVLLTQTPGYVLVVADDEIDSGEFERLLDEGRSLLEVDPEAASLVLGQALSMWRGKAYEDFTYESFPQTEIGRLTELRTEAIETRIEADLRRGMGRELIGELEALTREHPLREGLVGQLMQALCRSGRQAEALLAYGALSTRLGEELGIEPSVQLKDLEGRVVTGDPALLTETSAWREPGPGVGLAVRGYELREQIGAGSHGVVHRAYQRSVGREVAIKVIRAELANDPDFIRSFETHSQKVARLEHPHVVPLYDYWREPDAAYLVMRLMRGGDLATLLGERSMTVDDIVDAVLQITEAVSAAHNHGIEHGGINATNILFDLEGQAFLSDFGVAGEGARRTAGGDSHALGVILEECLSTPEGPSEVSASLLGVARRAAAVESGYPDVDSFKADLTRSARRRWVAPVSGTNNPYKGLRSFEAEDADLFFGRERLVERLVNRLGMGGEPGRFVALVGPSGSGKSSVIKAGLLPALRRAAVPGSDRWFLVEMVPGAQPFVELKNALERVAVNPPSKLLEQLEAEQGGLRRVVDSILPDDHSQVLIFIDQLEELFTQVVHEGQRRAFIRAITEAVSARAGRVRVVATLRADFYDRPLRYHDFGELIRAGTEVITPMFPAELERAVAGPAEAAGVGLEPGLATAVVSDVVNEASALPLMQYAMTELFERAQGGMLTVESYQILGGVAAALGQRAEGLYELFGKEEREATRQVFLALTHSTGDEKDIRRRILLTELTGLGLQPGTVDEVLNAYGSHRLLTFDRDPVSRAPTVELAHEALLSEWARYRAWVDDAREDLRLQRRLREAATEWRSHGEDSGYLLSGSPLHETEEWVASTELALPKLINDYITASREQSARERASRRRRRRVFTGLLASAATVAIVLLMFALAQRSTADRLAAIEGVNRLITSAEESLDFDPELSLLLGMAAAERTAELGMDLFPANLAVLHDALRADRLLFTMDGVTSAVFAPDGGLLYVGRPDGTVSVLDPTIGEQLGILGRTEPGVEPSGLAISDDGRWLTTGRLVIDTTSGEIERIWPTSASFDTPRDVAISGDGRYIAVVDFTPGAPFGFATVWDRDQERELWRIEMPSPVGVDFHPDDDRVAISSETSLVGASVRVYEVATGSEIEVLTGSGNLRGVAFHPLGELLLFGDTVLRHWHLAIQDYVNRDGGHGVRINDIDIAADGSMIVSGDEDGVVIVRDGVTGIALFPLPKHDGALGVVELSEDGTRLATVTEATSVFLGRLRVFDTSDVGGGDLATFDTSLPRLSTVDFHPSGETVAVGADDPAGSRQVWSITGGKLLELPDHQPLGLPLGVNGAIAFSPDGARVLTGDASGTVRLWDAGSGNLLAERRVDEIADLRDGYGQLSGLGNGILAAEFSPDGQRVGIAGIGYALVADASLQESRALWVHEIGWTDRVDFSADGNALIAGANPGRPVPEDFTNPVVVFDVSTGERLAELAASTLVVSLPVDYSPAGDLVAVGSDVITVYDADSYESLRVLRTTSGRIRDIAFSPDGSVLAAAYEDGTIRIWDPHEETLLYTLTGHNGAAADIDWSDGGSRLVSVGDDGMIRFYAVEPAQLIQLSRSMVTRTLTSEECRQYLADGC